MILKIQTKFFLSFQLLIFSGLSFGMDCNHNHSVCTWYEEFEAYDDTKSLACRSVRSQAKLAKKRLASRNRDTNYFVTYGKCRTTGDREDGYTATINAEFEMWIDAKKYGRESSNDDWSPLPGTDRYTNPYGSAGVRVRSGMR